MAFTSTHPPLKNRAALGQSTSLRLYFFICKVGVIMNEECLLKGVMAGSFEVCDGVKIMNEEVF